MIPALVLLIKIAGRTQKAKRLFPKIPNQRPHSFECGLFDFPSLAKKYGQGLIKKSSAPGQPVEKIETAIRLR